MFIHRLLHPTLRYAAMPAHGGGDITHILGTDVTTAHRRRWRRWLGWLMILAALAAGAVWWGSRDTGGEVQFRTQPARRGDITVTVTATGNLQPINQVDVGSELSGIIKSVAADYNSKVKAGQMLARLDTAKLEAQRQQTLATVAAAQAKVLQVQATVAEARNQLARLRHLHQLSGGEVPSSQELDSADAALKRAQADEGNARATVAQTRATLHANETDLAKAVIRAPISGIVLKRAVEPGQTVAASLQAPVLFTLAENLSQMQLHVNVDEADVGQVESGQQANFAVDAYPDRSYPARIVEVRYGPQTVQGVVTYEALLNADNADLSLRPGMTATADITVRTITNAILVPNAALRYTPPEAQTAAAGGGATLISRLMPRPPRSGGKKGDEGGSARKAPRVWTLRDGQPTPIRVKTGATDGAMTEIISGSIEPGVAVIVDTLAPPGQK